MTFKNDCTQPVWLAETNGVTYDVPAPFPNVMCHGWDLGLAQKCTADAQCPSQECDTTKGISSCQCTNFGSADLQCGDGKGGYGYCCSGSENNPSCPSSAWVGRCARTAQMELPNPFTGARFWGRTGCTGSGTSLSCDTGNCDSSGTDLADCFGFSGNYATLWEEALFGSGQTDNYDVSLVLRGELIDVGFRERGTRGPDRAHQCDRGDRGNDD